MTSEIIRARTAEHIAAARALFREYADWLQVDLCFQSFEQELARLPGDYTPPSGELLLAQSGSREFVGCVALHAWHGEPAVAEMKRLWVRPAAQGLGIGRLLLHHVIAEARLLSYRHLRLDTIADRMPAAVRLYRQNGFREIPSYRPNPEPSALYLELELDNAAG